MVELPDGRRIRGTGLGHPRGDIDAPDFAVYLLERDPGDQGWEYRWVRCPDFGIPASTSDALSALHEAHERARDERVEVACLGGVGRTGMGMSVLAVIAGISPEEAVAWTREHYRPDAVETPEQERWIRDAATLL
ncbi:protein phosphatase [Actinobacteria bacterium YIM 96077]|uniref:Protein phosphatase n=2 Tax=Phytoactinopolyspora halophila TaxID=1981511 RepID=A0A329QA33_9ACTN|nr:protein phosphatase [Actinobacteria bacterium YIM 96077]RAW09196.1 protein phosphatase [Phytoactinopolyspora halophila]